MKTLQNNFTTPEQSKRLLELGVPADSADCFYDKQFFGGNIVQTRMGSEWRKRHDLFSGVLSSILIPCWSVGRLMEIFEICDALPTETENNMCSIPSLERMSYIEYMMTCFTKAIEMKILDFSKLEE